MAEVDEAELVNLRAGAAEAAKHKADLAAEQAARKAEMDQVRAYLQQQAEAQRTVQPPPTAADPDGIVTRRDLADAAGVIRAETDRQLNERLAESYRQQRLGHAAQARTRLGDNFVKLEGEVEAMMNRLPVDKAAHPDAYNEVYAFVLSKHPELTREQIRAEVLAELATREPSESDEGNPAATEHAETRTAATAQPTAATPPARPAAPTPAASGAAVRPVALRKATPAAPLSAEQRYVGRSMGLTEDEVRQYGGDDHEPPDVFGMKGRSRV